MKDFYAGFLLFLDFYAGRACNQASFSTQLFLVFKTLKQPHKLITVYHTNDTYQETNIKMGTEF